MENTRANYLTCFILFLILQVMAKKLNLTTATAKKKIKEYFDNCDSHITEVEVVVHGTLPNGKRNPVGEVKKVPTKTKQKPYTMSGLASAIGLTTKEFKDIARPEYIAKKGSIRVSPAIKKILIEAVQRVEEYAEKSLYSNKTSGAQFVLKNIGDWKDKVEVDNPGLSEGIATLEKSISKMLNK